MRFVFIKVSLKTTLLFPFTLAHFFLEIGVCYDVNCQLNGADTHKSLDMAKHCVLKAIDVM